MKSKKIILTVVTIVAVIAATCGIAFAAWNAFTVNGDQPAWTVTAETPGSLTIADVVASADKYNGQIGAEGDVFVSEATATLTATEAMTLKATVAVTCTVEGFDGTAFTVKVVDATTGTEVTSLVAKEATNVKIQVTFPDLSDAKYYGASFAIAVTLGNA